MPRRKPRYGTGTLPTISQYTASVAEPDGLFRTLEEPRAQLDAYGKPRMVAGNSSVVFRVTAAGRQLMLKCYTKRGLHTERIYRFIQEEEDPLLGNARLLPEEIYVYDELSNAAFYDVVAADWIEGITLETEIRRAVKEYGPRRFGELARAFDSLAVELLGREWAHGDLKPENIIVTPDGKMSLVDFDAMFIPELEGMNTFETGTPAYQHPSRDGYFYNGHIDDYAIAVISVSLHALAFDPTLYPRHNTTDNIILNPSDILNGVSPGYTEVLGIFADRGEYALYELARSLETPTPDIYRLPDLLSRVSGSTGGKGGTITGSNDTAGERNNFRFPAYPVLEQRNGSWGYSDGKKTELIPHIYSKASEFTESLAVVLFHGMWQVIDTTGRIVFKCEGIESLKPFSQGLAAFKKGGKWGYLDTGGREVIEPRYEMAGSFHQDRAVVKSGGKYGFIDRDGRIVIDTVYEQATGFRDGKAIVISNGTEYKIDLSGYKT